MSWLDQLKGDSVGWLLEHDNLGVRYLAMRDLLDLPGDDTELQKAKDLAHSQGPIASILEAMDEEGYWDSPGPG